jgi:hypothetical protein
MARVRPRLRGDQGIDGGGKAAVGVVRRFGAHHQSGRLGKKVGNLRRKGLLVQPGHIVAHVFVQAGHNPRIQVEMAGQELGGCCGLGFGAGENQLRCIVRHGVGQRLAARPPLRRKLPLAGGQARHDRRE